MAERTDMDAAVRAAAESIGDEAITAVFGAEDGTGTPPEAPSTPETATPAPTGDDHSDVPPQDGDEAEPEAREGTGDEPPTTYFGVDLSDLPVEQRAALISELQERDTRIRSLMQRNAELAKGQEAPAAQQDEPAPTAQAPEPPVEMSDEDVLAAFGLSKDDPMYEVKADLLLPVAKRQLQSDALVQQLVAEREAEQALAYWDESLTKLESEYGELPPEVSHDDIIEFALENQIADPVSAFHAMTAGARKMLSDGAAKARREALEALKKQQAGGVRPTKTNAKPKVDIPGDVSLTEAIRQAATAAAEETGIAWPTR